MIVQRFTVQLKAGKLGEALELAKEGRKNIWPLFPSRIYSTFIGPMDTLVIENEYADLAEWEKLGHQIYAKEEWGQWVAKFNQLATGGGTIEIWNLE